MEGKPPSAQIPFFLPLPLRERAGVRGLGSQDVPPTHCHPNRTETPCAVAFLPLPLRERAGVRGLGSRMFHLPLPAQANGDAVGGFLAGLFRSFTLKRHVQ